MTDKLDLFRSSLIQIKRRIIKIEGGRLYLDQMRTIVIRSRKGKVVNIIYIYYISDLEVNLLLYRRLCILGLNRRFDTNFIILYMNDKNILKADYKKGVYVLTWISSKFPITLTINHILRLYQAFLAESFRPLQRNNNIIITKNKKSFLYTLDNIKNKKNIIAMKNEEILQSTDKENS